MEETKLACLNRHLSSLWWSTTGARWMNPHRFFSLVFVFRDIPAAPVSNRQRQLAFAIPAGLVGLGLAVLYFWRRKNRKSDVIITPTTRNLFKQYEEYLGHSPDAVTDVVIEARFWSVYKTALASHSYRCIHEKRFLEPRIQLHPFHMDLIHPTSHFLPPALQNKPIGSRRLLDVGCCFGTDLRQLLLEGFEPQNVLGFDINSVFINLGLDLLFEDRALGPLTNRFCTGNILEENVQATTPLLDDFVRNGGIDAIYIGSVYHLLNEPDTLRLSRSVFSLVKPGGCVFGRTVGVDGEGGSVSLRRPVNSKSSTSPSASPPPSVDLRFLHSASSLTEQLTQVGFINIRISARDVDMPGFKNDRSNKMLSFYAEKAQTK